MAGAEGRRPSNKVVVGSPGRRAGASAVRFPVGRALLLLLFVAMPAAAQEDGPRWQRCLGRDASVKADRRLDACTAIIDAGQLTPARRAAVLKLRAQWNLQIGHRDRAIADYDEAIRLQPGDADAFHARGGAHAASGDLDQAVADLTEALRLKPDAAPYYLTRGQYLAAMGRHDDAVADYDRTLALDPDAPDVFLYRAQAFDGAGRYDRAVADFDEVLRRRPDDAAYEGRCLAKIGLGQFEAAVADCTAALSLEPASPSALASRGLAYHRMRQFPLAMADYDAALRLAAHWPEALFGRGVLRRLGGDAAGGDADIAAALAVDDTVADRLARRGLTP